MLNKNGFTLIEAIIAISLLSLIALICTGALNIGLSSYEKIGLKTDVFESNIFKSYKIFDQLKHIQTYKYKNRDFVIFKGDNNKLEFISSVSIITPGIPGMFKVKYIYENGDLIIKEQRILDQSYLNKSLDEIDGTIFFNNLKNFSIEYLKNSEWYEIYENKGIPDAIKITLEDENKLTFIIPLLINKKL